MLERIETAYLWLLRLIVLLAATVALVVAAVALVRAAPALAAQLGLVAPPKPHGIALGRFV